MLFDVFATIGAAVALVVLLLMALSSVLPDLQEYCAARRAACWAAYWGSPSCCEQCGHAP